MSKGIDGDWVVYPGTGMYSFHWGPGEPIQGQGGVIFNTGICRGLVLPEWFGVDPAALIRDPKTKSCHLIRQVALGDVIVLMAAARGLQKAFPSVEFSISVDYSRYYQFASVQKDVRVVDKMKGRRSLEDGHMTISFDHYFELDHDKGSRVNRVDRVFAAFGVL